MSIWPAMDRMRISQREIIQLGLSAAALLIGVIVLFFKMHGIRVCHFVIKNLWKNF